MKLRYALSYQQLKPHHRKNTTRQRSAQQRAVSSKEQQISAISPATAPSQITTVQQTDADPARAVALIGSSEKVTVAAIDIGTNSFHLVVGVLRPNTAQGHCRGFEVIDQMKEGVRLLTDGGKFNLISSDGVEEAVRVLKRFQQAALSRGASLRAVATSAVREARNGQTFVRQVKDRLDLDVEVISGFEEARLIYLGVLQALPIWDKVALTIDIGGGSTEIVLGQKGRPLFTASMRLGSLRLQERAFPSLAATGEFSENDVENCRGFVRAALADAGVIPELHRHYPEGTTYEIAVGASGTIEAVASLAVGGTWEEHQELKFSKKQMHTMMQTLLQSRSRAARMKLPGMQAKRVDMVVPGAVLLTELFDALSIVKMTVSPSALREGVLQDSLVRLVSNYEPAPDIRKTSLLHVASRFDIERRMSSALHAAVLGRQLLEGLQSGSSAPPVAAALTADDVVLLDAGLILHSVGLFVSHASHHKHAAYIVRNSEHLLGFSPQEKEMIALIVRYHRKKPPSLKHEEVARLAPRQQESLWALVAIARLAIALERRNTAGTVASVAVLHDESSVVLVVTPAESPDGKAADISLELWALRQEIPYFEKVFQRTAVVVEGAPGDSSAMLLNSVDTVISS